MSTLPFKSFFEVLSVMLVEAYDGPPDPHSTWFIDNQPDCGILGSVRNLTAGQASCSMDGKKSAGSTIASHVEHLRWALMNVNRAIRGEGYQPDWKESWLVVEVSEQEWDDLRAALRHEYETMMQLINSQNELAAEELRGAMALAPHAAFHLGIIRQMAERVLEK